MQDKDSTPSDSQASSGTPRKIDGAESTYMPAEFFNFYVPKIRSIVAILTLQYLVHNYHRTDGKHIENPHCSDIAKGIMRTEKSVKKAIASFIRSKYVTISKDGVVELLVMKRRYND